MKTKVIHHYCQHLYKANLHNFAFSLFHPSVSPSLRLSVSPSLRRLSVFSSLFQFYFFLALIIASSISHMD